MKAFIIMMIFMLTVFETLGCTGGNREQKGQVPDRSGSLLRTIDRAENAQRIANLNTLRAAIAQYRVEHDRNPQTLDELRGQLGEDFRFDDYIYNPETGEATFKADLK